jgi:high-affinity nickel permease
MTSSDYVMIIGAIGIVLVNIITAWRAETRQAIVAAKQDEVISSVGMVEKHVNGHTTKLEKQIEDLMKEVKFLRQDAASKKLKRAVEDAERDK